MSKPVPGRHITADQRSALVRHLQAGVTPTHAARIVGVGRRSAYLIARKLGQAAQSAPIAANDDNPADPVEIRRLRDRLAVQSRTLRDLERRAVSAEDIRSAVFQLVEPPLAPARFDIRPGRDGQAETIVLFLSDLHWGERVDLGAMDGLNSYGLDIARARLKRWVEAVIDLATRHWSGPKPERIILILGGDLVSGEIHGELAKTNEAKAIPAVRDLVSHLAGAIAAIKDTVSCPLEVISLTGNHGRSTMKPESKEMAETSYDSLVSDFLEMTLRGRKGVTFYAPPSPDAVFSVYGWRVLATHGDRIGSRGGQGFVGPAATAARGMKRLVADYAARAQHLDLVLIGHFHTPLMLEEGFVNGSLPGPTEYSRDGRFRPHPATQLFLTMHPRRRIAQVRWIEVGAASEGALYAPPPPDRDLRPRYRVPAISSPQ